MIQQGKSETFLLFALENRWAQRAPAASVSSLTRLPQQDVFHAIVDVACWKHNETSMNPNYTSPGTTAALWDMVGAVAGSEEGPFTPTANNLHLRKQRQRLAIKM